MGSSNDCLAVTREIQARAHRGEAKFQLLLGRKYEYGDGAPANPAKAASWYLKAAKQNLAPAQYRLGRMYASGQGVRFDLAEAFRWFQRAAAQNYALAQNRIGVMYQQAEGVVADPVEALKWYALAARRSNNLIGDANREALARLLTPAQLAEAQRRIEVSLAAEVARSK
jgi:TPR repeat protein